MFFNLNFMFVILYVNKPNIKKQIFGWDMNTVNINLS